MSIITNSHFPCILLHNLLYFMYLQDTSTVFYKTQIRLQWICCLLESSSLSPTLPSSSSHHSVLLVFSLLLCCRSPLLPSPPSTSTLHSLQSKSREMRYVHLHLLCRRGWTTHKYGEIKQIKKKRLQKKRSLTRRLLVLLCFCCCSTKLHWSVTRWLMLVDESKTKTKKKEEQNLFRSPLGLIRNHHHRFYLFSSSSSSTLSSNDHHPLTSTSSPPLGSTVSRRDEMRWAVKWRSWRNCSKRVSYLCPSSSTFQTDWLPCCLPNDYKRYHVV